jgi:hypothetical protein
MKHKFSYKIKGLDVFLLILGFGLAFFDMTVLQKGIHLITGANTSMSTLIAFGIATIANTFALDWGITNGRNKVKNMISKKSMLSFLAWVMFGIVYIIIEIIATVNSDKVINWPNQIGQYIILAMSYIFSGLAIQKSAREMWDADASACRASENEYKVLRKRIAKEDSEINDMMTALENYSQNYDGLDEQFVKQSDAIRHAEDSVINEILGKTLQSNLEITPSEAKKVVEEAKRDFLK